MPSELTPIIEAQVLNQTEDALRELVQTAINCGIKPPQMVLMLRSVATDFEPKLVVPGPATAQ